MFAYRWFAQSQSGLLELILRARFSLLMSKSLRMQSTSFTLRCVETHLQIAKSFCWNSSTKCFRQFSILQEMHMTATCIACVGHLKVMYILPPKFSNAKVYQKCTGKHCLDRFHTGNSHWLSQSEKLNGTYVHLCGIIAVSSSLETIIMDRKLIK